MPRRSVKQSDTKICLCHKITVKLNVKTFSVFERLFIIILSLFHPLPAVFISLLVFQLNGFWHLYFFSPAFLFLSPYLPPLISVFFSCLLGEFPNPVFQLSNAILNVFILLPHRIIYFKNIIFHVQYFYFRNIWLSCRTLQICSFFSFQYILCLKTCFQSLYYPSL